MDKRCASVEEAIEGIKDGMTVLIGGFGNTGEPMTLLDALSRTGVRDLTLVNNNVGAKGVGIERVMAAECVRKFICSFPRQEGAEEFENRWRDGRIELELVPQGTLAERVRAAGAGIPGFYTRTAYGTPLAEGKEIREIDGREYVFERALPGDFAFCKALKADRWGNLVYYKSCRNFNPVMAMGAETTIVEVDEIVELGELDPENIITPGIFVDRVVQVEA